MILQVHFGKNFVYRNFFVLEVVSNENIFSSIYVVVTCNTTTMALKRRFIGN